MHCNVFELSRKPIKESDRMNENTLMDNDSFVGYVADYVADIDEPYEDTVGWLVNELGASVVYNNEDNSITFVHKDMFFKQDYDKFRELIKGVTFKKFLDWKWVHQVKSCLSQDWGTYIYFDYPMNINDFIRDHVKDGDKFYIGGVVDYHC